MEKFTGMNAGKDTQGPVSNATQAFDVFSAKRIETTPERQTQYAHVRYPRKPRLFYPRTKRGCLNCRQRKKRCDEIRPSCTSCKSRRVDCCWPSVSLSSSSAATNDSAGTSQSPDTNLAVAPVSHHTGLSEASACTPPLTIWRPESRSPCPPSSEVDTIKWSAKVFCFIGSERAAGLTPSSILLLQHYMTETGVLLGTMPPEENPYITSLLPVAYLDDLVMHAILALSGTHLGFKQKLNVEVHGATSRHYDLVLRGLQRAIDNLDLSDSRRIVRILLVLLILCTFEAISGNTNRSLFVHLRASHQLILKAKRFNRLDDDTKMMLGLSHEVYAYLVVINSIGPHGTLENRSLPIDSLVTNLSMLGEYSTFGAALVGVHGLFEIIPLISMLFTQRLLEGADASEASLATYGDLYSRIVHWHFDESQAPQGNYVNHCALVGEVYRDCLMVYLEAAMAGVLVDSAAFALKMQPFVNTGRLNMLELVTSPLVSVLLLPATIFGSCLVEEAHRLELVKFVRDGKFQMNHCFRVCEWLELLWSDPDPRMYGPYGLYLIMQNHNDSFCIV